MTADLPVTEFSTRAHLTGELGQSDSDRPVHPLSKAAEMTGVSLSTIKRRHAAGEFPNAVQDERGRWLVSVSDLLNAELELLPGPATATGDVPVSRVSEPAQPAPVDQLSRVAELERDLAAERAATALERARREAAERLAVEIGKRADLAERALLMLTAGTTTGEPPAEPATAHTGAPESAVQPSGSVSAPEVPAASRRTFWERLTGRHG